jgi:predicted AlkP superfamily pyrophosphatase or phosphodiesterase
LDRLLPAVGAHLGVPGCADDPFGLADARRYVVLLVDGLGFQAVVGALDVAPALADLMDGVLELTAVVPSTTAASLASLGTGLTPGEHGLVGYRFFVPDLGRCLAPLNWDVQVSPETVQPRPTWFQRAASAGVGVGLVLPPEQVGSGFTRAALRGPGTVAAVEPKTEAEATAWVETVVRAAAASDRSLVYAYHRGLDHVGHAAGLASDRWLDALVALDRLVARLRQALDSGTVLLITGDHGMVDVPADHRLTIEDRPELAADLTRIGGEGRFRHLYSDQPQAVAARWRDCLGDRAWVEERASAIAQGWFGPVEPLARARLGDVVVALRQDWAVLSRRTPVEAKLIGMHGSLTRREMVVPLFSSVPFLERLERRPQP